MGRVEITFRSHFLKRYVKLLLLTPGGHFDNEDVLGTYKNRFGKTKYKLLTLFHGFTGNYLDWERFTKLTLYVEETNVAVACVSLENKSGANINDDSLENFINIELIDLLTGEFNISKKASDHYIAGLSMGGYAALYNGIKNSKKYAGIAAFSPAIELKIPGISGPKDEALYNVVTANKENIPNLYISIGSKDILLSQNYEFVEFLKNNNINHEFHVFDGFDHEWRFWDIEIEKYLNSIK